MSDSTKNIYCISGLGADEKAFAKIKVPGYALQHLLWLTPEKDEALEAYAKRMAKQIPDANPILMGLSFGGMLCIEIAKLIPVEKVILISSIPSYRGCCSRDTADTWHSSRTYPGRSASR